MKLHDLRPAEGSRRPARRVGRGIAAGQGKTAGRGTKGQKARAGGSIPPWFEGGQTPLHMRIPKLRGFKNRFKVEYEVVNLGRIAELVELGAFASGEPTGKASARAKAAPITINQELLRAVGAVRTLDKPLKVLGHGDVTVALFVVADAFSKSAAAKIVAAGGTVQVLEIPATPLAALGVIPEVPAEPAALAEPETEAPKAPKARTRKAAPEAAAPEAAVAPEVPAEPAALAEPETEAPKAPKARTRKAAPEDAAGGVAETEAPKAPKARTRKVAPEAAAPGLPAGSAADGGADADASAADAPSGADA
jgi:large subunit ribosomal protein L15